MEPATSPAEPVPAPRRRRWRLIGSVVALMLALAVGGYFYRAWKANREWENLLASIEAEDPHWRYPDLEASRAKIPDDENSALQVLRIRGLLKTTPFDLPNNGWKLFEDMPPSAQLNTAQVAALQAAFAKLDPRILPEVDKLAGMPRGRFVMELKVNPFLSTEPSQECRPTMNLLQNLAMLRSQQGDPRGAVQACQSLFHVERAIADQPTLIGQLVRFAGQAIAVNALERALAQGEATEVELAALQAMIEQDIAEPQLYYGMRGERAGQELFARSIKEGKAKVSDIMGMTAGPGGGGPGFLERTLDQFPGIIERQFVDCLVLSHELTKISKLPPEEMLAAFKESESKIHSASMLARLLTPATHKVAEAHVRTLANLRCMRALLAAERFRLKSGRWPESLDELVKEKLLSDLPVDPYDGKPLRLKRLGDGVLVYSVNRDKTDNGGLLDRRNPMAPNTDLGLRLWNLPARRQPALPVQHLEQ